MGDSNMQAPACRDSQLTANTGAVVQRLHLTLLSNATAIANILTHAYGSGTLHSIRHNLIQRNSDTAVQGNVNVSNSPFSSFLLEWALTVAACVTAATVLRRQPSSSRSGRGARRPLVKAGAIAACKSLAR